MHGAAVLPDHSYHDAIEPRPGRRKPRVVAGREPDDAKERGVHDVGRVLRASESPRETEQSLRVAIVEQPESCYVAVGNEGHDDGVVRPRLLVSELSPGSDHSPTHVAPKPSAT